jgi:glycosyltransferase involved in cell wall biosynthesis
LNILLINHYAGSPIHGMEYRPYYFAKEWVRKGHNVTVVAASYSHLRQINPQCSGIVFVQVIDGIRYVWFRTPGYAGNGLGRVANIAIFILQLVAHLRWLVKFCECGAVIASSTYTLDVLGAQWIASLAHARLIYEVHDLWPLSPIELGGMSPRHPFIRVVQWAEDFAYKNVNHVVSMLPLTEAHMLAHGMSPGKFHYVPNGVDVGECPESETALPAQHQEVLSKLKLEGRFIVGYAGAHGVANALESVISAAGLLVDSPVVFVFVGHGPEKSKLQRLAAELSPANIVFLPSVPKAAIASLFSSMDCLIISLQRKSLFRFGMSPNKLMDYMMAGVPVINAVDAGNDMVKESGCGLSVPAEDPASIAEAARRMMEMTVAQRSEMGARGRTYVALKHDRKKLAAEFLAIMLRSQVLL